MKKNLKRAGAALLGLTLAASSLAGCGSGTDSASAETSSAASSRESTLYRTLDEIRESGTVRIGVFSDKSPFGYVDENGEYQGYDIYLADRLGRDLGTEIEYVSTEAANRIEYLQTGKVDIILANFTVTEERAQEVDFALPYMNVALGVVSPDSAVIESLDHPHDRNPPILKALFRAHLEIVRVMPQMVLLFIVYFGTTRVFGWNLGPEASAILVFAFWGSAEMGDLVRGALISIPRIQYESAMALGMDPGQVFRYVVLPQSLRRLLPLSINLITRMIKTTSLVMMIGIVEVLKVGQQIIEANRTSSPNAAFGVFAFIFLLYFLICWPVSRFSSFLEKRWST